MKLVFVSSTLAAIGLGSAVNSDASPTVSASSSTTEARKGQPFHVYLTITTLEDIEKLEISRTAPTGFEVELVNPQMPETLTSGSSFIADFLVCPPHFSWRPNAPGSDTREQKTFVFNVAYTTRINGQPKRLLRAEKLSIPYSLGPPLYMFTGILGLVLGNIIKTLNTHKRELFGQPGDGTQIASLGLLFRQELISLLTSVAIGFVALLVLARNEIPTKGWYDSMALGVTLAILADDQLLAKIKGS